MMPVQGFTLYDMLRRNARIYADRTAVIQAQTRLTFRDLLARVDALAAGLAALPLRKGERLCIAALNHSSYLTLYGACARLGVIAYPINWRLTSEEMGRVLERAAPRMLVIDDTTRATMPAWTSTAPVYRYTLETADATWQPLDSLYHTTTPAEPIPAVEPTDPFAVISTAAVDIVPRGAVLTHANMLAANVQTMACLGLRETDCHLLALPLFHVAALGAALTVLHAGGTNVVMPRFDAAQAVALIDAHQVTYLNSFPPILTQILDAADAAGSTLPSLKYIAGLEVPDAITRLHATTTAHFWTGFGQTETSGFVTMQRVRDLPGSAGKAAPLCDIRVVDEADRDVPVGTPGEIVVRGPLVFQGYFDQPEITAHTFRGGWHHTGDIGRFDADGALYYVQRKPDKALIKPGGENVYPAEVEAVILEIAGVTGACVFGVPDAQWGEAIKAVVEVPAARDLTAAQVIEYVGTRIARYKRPKWVVFTEALPTNAAGVVDRAQVQTTWGSPV